ncbi:MAG: fumarylacetoacetase [Frankiaceae bacterium]|nr:fumarylacetoacetase [Frankiaceae bacterium]
MPVPDGSDFTMDNLPYGVFRTPTGEAHVGVAIGEHILDLAVALPDGPFRTGSLNDFMSLGRDQWAATRRRVAGMLTSRPPGLPAESLVPQGIAAMLLPFEVADYVDFYSSLDHATNLGRLFRPGGEPLLPNWRHLPVGYHGRAGTVVVSGTPIARPSGQRLVDGAPEFGPSLRLDIEAEVGFVIGTPSPLGQPVGTAGVRDHVFGVVLVNDWSARDLQAWEYQPLGPFLGKSFATSISPWVVPLEALERARITPPAQDPVPMPYLQAAEDWGLDLGLEVSINGCVVSRPPFAGLYWTIAQQLAHMTSNGASLRTGDLLASGTVSGPEKHQRGSLIELSWNGAEPLTIDGAARTFLEDGDLVTITATTLRGPRIGFGSVTGIVGR